MYNIHFFRMIQFNCLLLIFIFCLPVVSFALFDDKTTDQIALELQQHYSGLTSLQFSFSQITGSGGRKRHGMGDAVFVRTGKTNPPGKTVPSVMRWNYHQPDKQIIINDGKNISIYTEKDRQQLVTSANEMDSDITYAFLTGTKNPLDDFKTDYADARFHFSIPGTRLDGLQLIPKEPHSQVQVIHLWYDEQLIIHKIIIEDHFDTLTELVFADIRLNSLQGKDQQEIDRIIGFIPPEGTEIITQ